MSATYRKLKPALDNPAIVSQAIEQTKRQISIMGNDAVSSELSSEEMAEKDDALTRYLNMYGYNDDSASDGLFQAVFKNNAQQLYTEQQAKQVSLIIFTILLLIVSKFRKVVQSRTRNFHVKFEKSRKIMCIKENYVIPSKFF